MLQATIKREQEKREKMKKLLIDLLWFFKLFKESAKIEQLDQRLIYCSNLKKEVRLLLTEKVLSVLVYYDEYNIFNYHYDLEGIDNFRQLKTFFNKELAKIGEKR